MRKRTLILVLIALCVALMPTTPKIKEPPTPNLLSILPAEFTRQLNPAGRRTLARTAVIRIPGGMNYVLPGLALISRDAPISTLTHEAMHILNIGGRLSPQSPPEYQSPVAATQFYTAGVHPWLHLPRMTLFPGMRRDEVLAAGVQRTNIIQQPISMLSRYGWTSSLLRPLVRFFSPTSLGLAGGIRSEREIREMR